MRKSSILYVLTGTKQSYAGPLNLVNSIRMALDDISHINCSASDCKNSEDTPQNNTKEKNSNSQNEDVNPVRRRKVS